MPEDQAPGCSLKEPIAASVRDNRRLNSQGFLFLPLQSSAQVSALYALPGLGGLVQRRKGGLGASASTGSCSGGALAGCFLQLNLAPAFAAGDQASAHGPNSGLVRP